MVAKKQYEGELEFSFEAEEELLDLPFARFASEVAARLRFEIFEDDSVKVKGKLSFVLEGLCSRCLSSARQEIEREICAVFTAEEPKDEEYSYERGTVDLSEFLRDSVIFALPTRLLCPGCEEEE